MSAAPPADRSGLSPELARIVTLFETLAEADIDRLGEHYSADAYFKDPFNEVRGVPAIQGVFRHMFVALRDPRFVVRDVVANDQQCFITWDFLFHFRRFDPALQTVRGCSHLRFDSKRRVCFHRDYWDAAEELYEKLPLVGGLMRWLKRRANT